VEFLELPTLAVSPSALAPGEVGSRSVQVSVEPESGAEKSVRRISFQGDVVNEQEVLFAELDERIREVSVGPDGYIYLLTDSLEGCLLRIRPK